MFAGRVEGAEGGDRVSGGLGTLGVGVEAGSGAAEFSNLEQAADLAQNGSVFERRAVEGARPGRSSARELPRGRPISLPGCYAILVLDQQGTPIPLAEPDAPSDDEVAHRDRAGGPGLGAGGGARGRAGALRRGPAHCRSGDGKDGGGEEEEEADAVVPYRGGGASHEAEAQPDSLPEGSLRRRRD